MSSERVVEGICGILFENNNPALLWGGLMKTTGNFIWDIQCSGWDSNGSYGEPLTLTAWPQCLQVPSVLTPGDILGFGVSF
jgi:hypothetical protein